MRSERLVVESARRIRRARSLALGLTVVLAWVAATASEQPEAEGLPHRMIVDETFQSPPVVSPIQGFTAYGGQWELKEGVLHAPAGFGPKLIHQEARISTGEVGVEVFLPGRQDGNAGLIVKVSEPGIGADRFNGYEVALNAGTQKLTLGRHRQNFELLRDADCRVPENEWVTLVTRWTEQSVEVLVNGRSVVRQEDREHPLRAGGIGLRPWVREARFRHLWIQTNGRRQVLEFTPAKNPEPQTIHRGWQAVTRGTAHMEYALTPPDDRGTPQSQRIRFLQGTGDGGISYAGTDGKGLRFLAGRPYPGFVVLRGEQATELLVAAESADGRRLGETTVRVRAGDWQAAGFRLAPAAGDEAGRLTMTLKAPGTVELRRAFLAPGDWAWPETLAVEKLAPVVFLKRHMLGAPPAVGCDVWAARPARPGGAICLANPARPELPPRTLFADDAGSIYDLNLSLDAKTIFFSYARKDEKHWHLWRVGVDGTGLQQLTDGPFYDVSPCELPDGSLMFVSTRRFGHTVCQPGPASNLYRLPREGGPPQCVSMNTLSDTTPQLLPDGRVLFMRWEYVDRDLTFRQSLWTQNPDGTGYQLYFGNTVRDPATFWQARPIPGRSDRLLATFAPHHGYPHGAIGWVDRNYGPETPRGAGFDWITREFPTIGDTSHAWSYRDPFPLDASSFLCAYGGGGRERFRIFIHDRQDRRRLLYEDENLHCFFPIAVRPAARVPVLASRAPASKTPDLPENHPAEAQPMGTCLLVDVYQGLGPAIERGRVKSIRIMEQVRKTEDIPVTPQVVDFGPRAYDQSPLMSYGTYYAKRCWGSVPVEADGSAHFNAPALREIYFQACDAEGRELQRMTSAAQLMPGETISCMGCHESRVAAPAPARTPLAFQRPPSVPRPPAWAPDGMIDFVTVVQPVLDRHCVRCHSGGNPDGGYDLSGDKTRLFNVAYDHLLGRSRSYRQHNMDTGEMLPEEAAKGKPLVHFYWLLKTPTAVNQPLWTGSHASRLPDYLTEKHCGQPLPPEDRERIYTWIDANVPYYGTYATSRPRCGGKRDLCADPRTGELAAWFAKDFLSVYGRRCAECHGAFQPDRLVTCWDGRTAWINFTRPPFSPALTAHLPKTAGGRGIDRTPEGKPIPGFNGLEDPDYLALLHAIEQGRRETRDLPGPDMPGFGFARKEP